jgi:transposase
MAVEVTRRDLSADSLRRAAAHSREASAARRMLAIALVLEGYPRQEAAEMCGMDRQTLRDWVHRYNAAGLVGLSNRVAPGPTPRLSAEQEATFARWIEEGPDVERHGVVRWRCRDLQERIEREFEVKFHERTIGKLLAKLKFRRLSVRPQHPESDIAAQEAFRGASLTW